MKILLTADLHFRIDWFRWLIEQLPDTTWFVLPVMYSTCLTLNRRRSRRVRSVVLIRELADIVPLAICSGNHDNAGGLISHDRASIYKWFLELGTHPKIVTDGRTRKLENLVFNDRSLSLFERRKVNLAGSGCDDSSTNRDALAWCFIMFRPKVVRVSAAKKGKPSTFC